MTEERSIGYEEGYQTGWNAATDAKPEQPAQQEPYPLEEMQEEILRLSKIISTNAFYQAGHANALEWAAEMAVLEDPRTSDWVYDDPHELAKALRKGPDFPSSPQPAQPLPFGVGGGLVAIKTLLSRDPCVHASTAIQMIDAILAGQPTAKDFSVVEQQGVKLVPAKPTRQMLEAGAEDLRLRGLPLGLLVGAEECYRAMLNAAPQPAQQEPVAAAKILKEFVEAAHGIKENT